MIWAYPDELTVSRQLVLHVSTKAPAFRVDAYRQGVELEFVGCLGNGLAGSIFLLEEQQPPGHGRLSYSKLTRHGDPAFTSPF